MDDLVETLWAQFAIETEEHLEYLESQLLAVESGEAPDVAALFRAFHSLKGLSRAMDLHSMQAVAHRSEDLLGLVREERIRLTPELCTLLVEGVDHLKGLRQQAVTARANGPLPEELVGNLEKAHARALEEHAPPPPAAALPPPTHPSAPSQITQSPSYVHSDPEMLRFFAELFLEEFPRLAGLLLEEYHASEETRKTVRDSLEALQQASEVMEFERLSNLIADLAADLPAAWPLPPAQEERIRQRLLELRDLAQQVKEESGVEQVLPDLPVSLQRRMREEVGHLFRRILTLLDGAGGGDSGGLSDEDVAAEISRITSSINTYLLFFDCDHACYLMLLLQDLFHQVKSTRLYLTREVLDAAREAVGLGETYYLATQTGEPPPPQSDMDRVVGKIRKCFFSGHPGKPGEDPLSLFQTFLDKVAIEPGLLEILSPANIHDLMHAIQQGGHPFEIVADMESSPDAARGFIAWLGEAGQAITNRTLFSGSQTLFEYLVVSRHPLREIEAELRRIDPEGRLFRVKACPFKAGEAAPAAAPSPREKSEPQAAGSGGPQMIRVSGDVLDRFMNQIGEMVLARSRIHHAATDDKARLALMTLAAALERLGQKQACPVEELEGLRGHLEALKEQQKRLIQADLHLHATLTHLQEGGMGLRVVPIDTVFKRFPRVVRDLAQTQGKNIRLQITGQEVRIDKGMVDSLVDPLLHMVRNAVDHGIETPEQRQATGKSGQATLSLSALQSGNRVVVELSDDGRGIDAQRVRDKAVKQGLVSDAESRSLSREQIFQFIFQAGFSTAEVITETSGRGVGMDVVRTTLNRLGGTVRVQSEMGQGSRFTLELPLSAAIQNTLLVRAGGQILALPDRFVAEILTLPLDAVQSVKGRAAILLRDAFLPVAPLATLLSRPRSPRETAVRESPLVVISNGKNRMGLLVERVEGRQELFVKEIHPQLAAMPGVGGASILGDGRVVLILDGEDLFLLALQEEAARNAGRSVA